MYLGRDEDSYENLPAPDPERQGQALIQSAYDESRKLREDLARSMAEYEVIPAMIDTDRE
jgi:hypothetical protein